VNVLLRVVLRDPRAPIPKQTANALRDRLLDGLTLTQGEAAAWSVPVTRPARGG